MGKKFTAALAKVETRLYALDEAMDLVKSLAYTKFDRPKMLTRIFTLLRSTSTSSTKPLNPRNGPSMTRTVSPRLNAACSRGTLAPESICLSNVSASSSVSGRGTVPPPTNPVTFGVAFTSCEASSVIAMCTRTYPGKNFLVLAFFFPFLISTTSCVGTNTSSMVSSIPFNLHCPNTLVRTWPSNPASSKGRYLKGVSLSSTVGPLIIYTKLRAGPDNTPTNP